MQSTQKVHKTLLNETVEIKMAGLQLSMKIQVSTRVRVKMPLHFRTVARKGKLSIEEFCSVRHLKTFLDLTQEITMYTSNDNLAKATLSFKRSRLKDLTQCIIKHVVLFIIRQKQIPIASCRLIKQTSAHPLTEQHKQLSKS